MPLPIVPKSIFPNVPNLPGIPPVKRRVLSLGVASAPLLIKDLFSGTEKPAWGIYDDKGKQALQPDSFLGIEYRATKSISDFPIEKGSFESYNKVFTPYLAIVSVSKGGTLAERDAFLRAVHAMADDLKLYTVVTPERSYQGVNVARFDYERKTRNGAHILIVRLHFEEIREASLQASGDSIVPESARTNATTSTGLPDATGVKAPGAQSSVNQGQVFVHNLTQALLIAQSLTAVTSW